MIRTICIITYWSGPIQGWELLASSDSAWPKCMLVGITVVTWHYWLCSLQHTGDWLIFGDYVSMFYSLLGKCGEILVCAFFPIRFLSSFFIRVPYHGFYFFSCQCVCVSLTDWHKRLKNKNSIDFRKLKKWSSIVDNSVTIRKEKIG